MEKFIKFYVLFHGYVLAILAIIMSISIVTLYDLEFHMYSFLDLSYYTQIEWMGDWIWLISFMWLATGISFFYGIIYKDKRALFPYIITYGIHMFIIVLREVLIESDTFFAVDAYILADCVYATVHICITMEVLTKFFNEENSRWEGTGFGLRQTHQNASDGKDVENPGCQEQQQQSNGSEITSHQNGSAVYNPTTVDVL
ncbi:uncharacterized protein LOC129750969 [Uranotaenia lowii]|uniref:uncharacterized protein LOC129750969 n=1 Tax=Uranotaenia lowii TaxID=190385 RepID=UPI002478B1FE|nr:uncharacterized protein LOC129750969 [Uranotaenia lowii]